MSKERFWFQNIQTQFYTLAVSRRGRPTSRHMPFQVEAAHACRRACFVNPTLVIFAGVARVSVNEGVPHTCMHIGQVLYLRPMEECLLSGCPCTLLPFVIRQGSTILCGHSLGVTVAITVAVRLTTCGLCVRGVVGLDPRTSSPNTWPVGAFQSLVQSLAPLHFRCW